VILIYSPNRVGVEAALSELVCRQFALQAALPAGTPQAQAVDRRIDRLRQALGPACPPAPARPVRVAPLAALPPICRLVAG
jgi:hypothetical protein